MENKTAVIFDTETTGFTEPVLIEAAGIIIKGGTFYNGNDVSREVVGG